MLGIIFQRVINVLTDLGSRKVVIKIVYTGPAMSGKTTSLRHLFNKFDRKTDLQSIETREGRTLFFDWGSVYIQKGQWKFQIDLWSATGQDFYAETRPTVLSGVDGIVFVADSQLHLMDDNKSSWNELNLMLGNRISQIPIIISLNKRDFPNTISTSEFKQALSLNNSMELFETIAVEGVNVLECFKALIQKIFNH
ncbi:MAG: gliding-motility protein MglA [Promethearchaeota archaeon]|nr:MAG: gliding-motility protein MglA [Candidatus Lokiarchaeota archaeon]